jgi:predicted Zn-dependent peptidase
MLVKDALAAEKNNTRSYAAMRLRELMSRDGDRFPTLEYLLDNVMTVSAAEITEHYARLIASAPMSVFYVGRASEEHIASKLTSAFSEFKGSVLTPSPRIVPSTPKELFSVTEDMPVSQGKLALGFRTGTSIADGTHAVAVMLNEILGTSPASKLFMNVRERLGLCYYCASSYSIYSGNLSVATGLDVSNRQKAEDEILRQIDDIRKGNISDAEWTAARKSLEYTYVQIYDSPFALQSFYTNREFAGIDESVEDFKRALLSVTREEVSECAKNTVLDTRFFINGTSQADGCEEVSDDE